MLSSLHRTIGLASSFVLLAFALGACDSGGRGDEASLDGTWRLVGGSDDVIVVIDEPLVEVYEELEINDCYEKHALTIERLSGDTYELRQGGESETSTITVDDDVMTVGAGTSGEEFYRRSDIDVSTLDVC